MSLQQQPSVIVTKASVLNPISLNASREHFSDLFNNFKKINSAGFNKPTTTSHQQLNSKTSISSSTNESIDLVNVVEDKNEKLVALYVGDLHPSVTEELLYNHFKRYQTLSSVKICYLPNSKTSLGYGYVNFESGTDAKQAIEDLNYTLLSGKEIRIMPSLQGKNKKFLGTNVFISNLNLKHDVTLRSFYEKFRNFGEIVSCKLDRTKRQGFISFSDKETAEHFVSVMNETNLDGSKIYCSIHIPKYLRDIKPVTNKSHQTVKEPQSGKDASPQNSNLDKNKSDIGSSTPFSGSNLDEEFKQVYIKGLPFDVTETDILKLLSECGKIVEVFVESVEKYMSSWSLVTFHSATSARLAVENFHKTKYKGRRLTCVKALKKAERKVQLSEASPETGPEVGKNVVISRSQSLLAKRPSPATNPTTYKVYIENLPHGINENFFKMFLRHYKLQGNIIKYSINHMSQKNQNFIEFENEEDAKEVNAKINGVNIGDYVLRSALGHRPRATSISVSRSPSLHRENSQLSLPTVGSPAPLHVQPTRSYKSQVNKPSSSYQLTSPLSFGLQNSSPVTFGPTPHIKNRDGSVYQLVSVPENVRSGSLSSISNTSPSSLMSRLEDVALDYIDFLKYPTATRPRNLKRIIQYLVDTHWRNDLTLVNDVLNSLETVPEARESFKKELCDTMKLLGFARS